ncbi:hypothetical protein AVEN_84227-1 [Araneus ventricosus]|uniref:Uncharacterized protein n=1 Tax=Araneus ventricosus TaxID=182803 RepID=A0A4Y2L1W9_ARAVE|nr:hypothetical protein AVEN_84227-1 [Araneus ventricosus]
MMDAEEIGLISKSKFLRAEESDQYEMPSDGTTDSDEFHEIPGTPQGCQGAPATLPKDGCWCLCGVGVASPPCPSCFPRWSSCRSIGHSVLPYVKAGRGISACDYLKDAPTPQVHFTVGTNEAHREEDLPPDHKRQRQYKKRGSKKNINKGPNGELIGKVPTEKSGRKPGKPTVFQQFYGKTPDFYAPTTPTFKAKAQRFPNGEILCTPARLLPPSRSFSGALVSILSGFSVEEKLDSLLMPLMTTIDQKFNDMNARMHAFETTATTAPRPTYVDKVVSFSPALPGPQHHMFQAPLANLSGTSGIPVPFPTLQGPSGLQAPPWTTVQKKQKIQQPKITNWNTAKPPNLPKPSV